MAHDASAKRLGPKLRLHVAGNSLLQSLLHLRDTLFMQTRQGLSSPETKISAALTVWRKRARAAGFLDSNRNIANAGGGGGGGTTAHTISGRTLKLLLFLPSFACETNHKAFSVVNCLLCAFEIKATTWQRVRLPCLRAWEVRQRHIAAHPSRVD